MGKGGVNVRDSFLDLDIDATFPQQVLPATTAGFIEAKDDGSGGDN